MKKILSVALLLAFFLCGFYIKRKYYDPYQKLRLATNEVRELSKESKIMNGDIIFQTSLSKQSQAIQLATHSSYSHCGLIYIIDKQYFVYEAVQPVKLTPLNRWIAKGKGEHFVIKRLKDAGRILTPYVLNKMKKIADSFAGKNYDIYFDWSDDKIYCSELVWKVYERATGLQIGKLQMLKDFDLTNPIVKQLMKARYGNKIPFNEPVISPVSIFNSDFLILVASK